MLPLPTAFLSTHTGGFEGFTFLDMTDEMSKVADHWASLGLTFQAVYSGFLGSERQIGVVENFICRFRGPDTVVVVDPVMGTTAGSTRPTPPPCAAAWPGWRAGGRHHPQPDGGSAAAGPAL
ncbi:MAG: hypothetical protein ACLTYN_08525 [Dysosmobacter welbionis]